jgi:hypothetical protein
MSGCRENVLRRFGAKSDKKICRRSGGEPEFMEDASHGRLDGIVVAIDRFWVVCAARGAEWLSGSEQGFDGFVAQDEERCYPPEAGQQRLVAAGVAARVCALTKQSPSRYGPRHAAYGTRLQPIPATTRQHYRWRGR